jgi:ribonuclease HI
MYYAVRKGLKIGLLTNKLALENAIKDYPSPEYKEFTSMIDAMKYLSNKEVPIKKELLIQETSTPASKSAKDDFNTNKKEIFYAVRVGRVPGLYKTWNECVEQIKHFPNQQFKKFTTRKDALNYVQNNLIDIDYDNNYDDSVLNVYTDGSSYHNGKPDCKASYGVYFGENEIRNESGLVLEGPSNNSGELMGILRAIELIKENEEAVIHTDSAYGIKCVSDYGQKMKKLGYPTEIPNINIIKKLMNALQSKPNIRFHHLNSHTNKTDKHSIGNDKVDKMATSVLAEYR